VWSALPFFGAVSAVLSHGRVLLAIGCRLLGCVACICVFGCLTLRIWSVLPAAVSHSIQNVFVGLTFGPRFLTLVLVRTLLWGALAYVLFRYWPVRLEGEQGASTGEVTSQPGTWPRTTCA